MNNTIDELIRVFYLIRGKIKKYIKKRGDKK